jgi:ElaB/YqjD/DUF883 family membrane-anchored ribosome-binding protein
MAESAGGAFGGTLDELDRDVQSVFEPAAAKLMEAVDELVVRAEADIGKVRETFDLGADRLVETTEAMKSLLEEMRTRIDGVLVQVRERNSVMQGAFAEWKGLNAGHFDECWSRTDELYDAIGEQQATLAAEHDVVRQQVATWVQEVQAALSALGEQADGLGAEFDAFEEANSQRFETLTRSFDELSDTLSRESDVTLDDVRQATERTLNDAEAFLRTTASHLEQGASMVSQGLELFGEEGRRVGQVFDSSVGQVLGKVQEVLNILDRIRPFLDLIDQLT